jgi:hypothetical protein
MFFMILELQFYFRFSGEFSYKQRKLFREPSRQIGRTCARDDPTQRHASGRQIPLLAYLTIYMIFVGSQIRSSGMRPGTHYRPPN